MIEIDLFRDGLDRIEGEEHSADRKEALRFDPNQATERAAQEANRGIR
ncbi:hypothetical protein M1D34_28580 (plasmid) [Ensifer sp. D2-11]